MRLAPIVTVVVAVLAAAAALTGCSSSDEQPASRSSPASRSASDPGVVDGITIPPVYVTPEGTVVPGPMSCPTDFATAMTTAAGGATFAVKTQLTAHLLTCTYQAVTVPSGACSGANILVNTEPQAYKAFDRWNVETGQNSMWTGNPALQPTPIPGIGTEAEWAPALLELGTGNDTTWVSVILTCPANTPPVLQLAEQLAVEGLASSA